MHVLVCALYNVHMHLCVHVCIIHGLCVCVCMYCSVVTKGPA